MKLSVLKPETWLLLALSFLFCPQFFGPQIAAAAPEYRWFENPQLGISLPYPEYMQAIEEKHDNALLLLKHTDSHFPTFNVLLLPSNPLAGKPSESKLVQEVESSYKLVGITDVEILEHSYLPGYGTDRYWILLRYTNAELPLVSFVALVGLPDSSAHLVLTWIDHKERSEQTRQIGQELLKSLRTSHAQAVVPADTAKDASSWSALAIFASLALISTLWWLFLRTKHASK